MARMNKKSAGSLRSLYLMIRKFLRIEKVICPSCRYNWQITCHRSERNRAVWCPDYEKM